MYLLRSASLALLSLFLGNHLCAQTMNVVVGEVTYAHAAAHTGDMTFDGGTTLTIEGKSYQIAEISSIKVTPTAVADNTVSVSYNGSSAAVVVAGNIARHLTVSANGANVSIIQSEALQNEVTYTLSGTAANGSFYMDGEFKANFMLNNLTLANPHGAAIDIEDGKKINITLTGANTLSDGNGGSHNACFYINGHPEFLGSGSLTVNGNTKHAISADEHMVVTSGTITVNAAATDGIHVNEYFQMDGGTVNITASGDGIDVGFKGVNSGTKDQYEKNGMVFLYGGTLNVSTHGAATKALKADSTIMVAGATITATTTGHSYYDTAEKDIASSSAVRTKGPFYMTRGTLTATSRGSGGKGINADGKVYITGGKVIVTTTGEVYEYQQDLDSKAQGIKSDSDITISGGEVYVCASDDKSTAFKTDASFIINGGTIMGIAKKKSTVATSSKQGSKYYTGVKVTGGSTISYNGVSYTVPAFYNNASANIMVSKAGM